MRTFERLGTIVTAVLVGILLILAVGFWQNWFTVSMDQNLEQNSDGRQLDLTLSVHPEAIQRDAEEAGRQVTQAEQHIAALSEVQSAEGIVTQVETARKTIVIRTGADTPLQFQLESSAEVRVRDQVGTLSELHVGDHITVVYRVRDKVNVAEKLTVL